MYPHFNRATLALILFALLQACGGGGERSDVVPALKVYGTAATGLAINGTVTLRDATGATLRTAISQPSGDFDIDVTGLTPPYFLKASDKTGMTTLYSVATGDGNFNINPLTNLAVIAAAMAKDPLVKTPDVAFKDPAKYSSLTPVQLKAAMDKVMALMTPEFRAALAANGASNVSPLTDSFQVGNGLDKVFDMFAITLTATGVIQESQVVNNTTTTTRVLGLVDILNPYSLPAGALPVSCGNLPLPATPQAGTLIVTALPVCKTYDGQIYIGGNGVIYEGFLNGETPAVLGGTLTYGGTWQSSKNAGTYTITPGGLTSGSYNIIYVGSTLTIVPLTLPILAINTTKIYNGSTTAGGVVGTGSGIISGDVTLTSGTGTIANTSISTPAITGSGATNYTVPVSTISTTVTITSATIAPSTNTLTTTSTPTITGVTLTPAP